MTQVIARFSVTGWEPQQVPPLQDEWAGAVTMRKAYTEGLVGESIALFVASGPTEGERAYVAVERITTARGAVTVHHGGLESDPSRWFGHIVPGSGTGELTGWSGGARIEHDEGGAFFVLDVTVLDVTGPGEHPVDDDQEAS